jgi:AcrR family transcriptional regulator
MQARAEATRRMIVDTAVGLFDSVGYRNASLADLITATGVSKGAFYYHFTNRESVAAAIIEEADDMLQTATREILSDPAGRAFGNLIRSIFEIAAMKRRISLLRVGVQLRGGLEQISTATEGFKAHRDLFTTVAQTGIDDGDIRADLDADQVGNALWVAVLGTHQHCDATGEDIALRLADLLTIMLPSVCTAEAGPEHLAQVKQLTTQWAEVSD